MTCIENATNGHHDLEAATNLTTSDTDPSVRDGPLMGPPLEPLLLSADEIGLAPQSPYSANRTMLRDLTLPPAPDLDIPPSPPGSPSAKVEKKLEHFLDLKRKKIHFNEKLARSPALKNPRLLSKLMNAAGLEEHDQYATTLQQDVWNPQAFPNWAFKEGLAKSQHEVTKRKEEDRLRTQREAIEFVSTSTSEQPSRSGTPAAGGPGKVSRGSVAERVMAGLGRDRATSSRSPKRRRRSPSR